MHGHGLSTLLSILEREAKSIAWGAEGGGVHEESLVITRARHRQHVQEAVDALERYQEGIQRSPPLPPDMSAEDLRIATRALAALTGRVEVDEVLEVIFRDFCIGK